MCGFTDTCRRSKWGMGNRDGGGGDIHMNTQPREPLWTKEFLGISLSNFLLYIAQYAMIAALHIVIMT